MPSNNTMKIKCSCALYLNDICTAFQPKLFLLQWSSGILAHVESDRFQLSDRSQLSNESTCLRGVEEETPPEFGTSPAWWASLPEAVRNREEERGELYANSLITIAKRDNVTVRKPNSKKVYFSAELLAVESSGTGETLSSDSCKPKWNILRYWREILFNGSCKAKGKKLWQL